MFSLGGGVVPAWGFAYAMALGFHVALERGRDPSLAGRPVAVVRGGKVLDASPELRARGIAPGLGRANLLELCPDAVLLPYRGERYLEGQRRLLDLFSRQVPAVEPAETTAAFLDVAGLAPAVCRGIGREAWAGMGVAVGFGLGPTKALARAAGLELARKAVEPGAVLAVPQGPGEPKAFLDALPVRYLYPLPAEVPVRLERLGFRTVGEVAGLPQSELVRQFGRPLARRIAVAAAGGEADPVRRDWPPPSLRVVRRFEGGLGDRGSLERALADASGALSGEMTQNGLACGEVSLSLAGEDGHRAKASRRLVRPGRSKATLVVSLVGLAGQLLGAWPPEDPPAEMEVRVGRVLPLAAEQLEFFGTLAGGPEAKPRSGAGEATAGLAWRFGDKVVGAAEEEDLSGEDTRRERREDLLAFYDPLRAGGRLRG